MRPLDGGTGHGGVPDEHQLDGGRLDDDAVDRGVGAVGTGVNVRGCGQHAHPADGASAGGGAFAAAGDALAGFLGGELAGGDLSEQGTEIRR